MLSKKKNIILSIIGVTLILLILIGATFAYFQAQINDGASSEVAIDIDTVDILTFNASNDIMLEATQDNFSREKGNISGSTTLNAHLIANSTTQSATYKYNVYLDITKNNFVYSKNSSTPEIVLVIKNPQGQYVTSYNSKLGGSTKNVDLNGTNVPGYDITTKIGLIEISLDYIIDASPSTKGEAEQNWEISVVFVNLDSNQVANAGKSFKAKAKVQSEKINVLDLGSLDSYYKNSTYRAQIKKVYFVNYIAPEDELTSVGEYSNWDLSSVKDGSIMGWLKEENEDETAPYNLYIGSNLKEREKIIVRSFAYAFYYMSNLETIDLNLDILDTSNLNDTSRMFYYNQKLTTIIGIEELDVSNVTNMSSMFESASSLTELDLSKWDTSNVTNMSRMFDDANKLATLNLSNWNTHNVTDMSYMFNEKYGTSAPTKLSTIIGIEDLDVSNVTNMCLMFFNVGGLTELDLSSWDTHNVTSMSQMFGVTKLNRLNLSNWDLSGTKLFKSVTNCYAPFDRMFTSIENLQKIEGIETWNVSEVTDMSAMFQNNSSLIELDLSNWDTSNVTKMSSMFYGTKLTTLDLSNWNTAKVTNMSSMFYGANGLTSLDLSKWDTHNVTDMSGMFSNASKLTSLDMRKATFTQVTNYSRMFQYTNSSLKVTITGDANKNWFIDNGVLTESKLNVLSS